MNEESWSCSFPTVEDREAFCKEVSLMKFKEMREADSKLGCTLVKNNGTYDEALLPFGCTITFKVE